MVSGLHPTFPRFFGGEVQEVQLDIGHGFQLDISGLSHGRFQNHRRL